MVLALELKSGFFLAAGLEELKEHFEEAQLILYLLRRLGEQ